MNKEIYIKDNGNMGKLSFECFRSKNGKGIQYWTDGSYYEGYWINNK